MDQNGQLSFSDDPLLIGSNEVYQLIEEGRFTEAIQKLDTFMDVNPDYPGFVEGYRTARFWDNRVNEINKLNSGKQTADFLMREWEIFEKYAKEHKIFEKAAYNAAMKHIFFSASENYKIAFQEQESTADNFDLLLNLGYCFLTLEEYQLAIETLEYARSSYKNSAKLLSILGEAYFNTNDTAKSMLLFKEAFFIDPSEIEMNYIKTKPILDLVQIVREKKSDTSDEREWIPIFGFIEDFFYARRNLNRDQVETIKQEIYNLEKSYQTMTREKSNRSSVLPRLINKYIWMLDYFKNQEQNDQGIKEIESRLKTLDKGLFESFFDSDQ